MAGRRSWTRHPGGGGITRAERPPSRPGLPAAGGAGARVFAAERALPPTRPCGERPVGLRDPFSALSLARARRHPAFSETRRPEVALTLIGPGFFLLLASKFSVYTRFHHITSFYIQLLVFFKLFFRKKKNFHQSHNAIPLFFFWFVCLGSDYPSLRLMMVPSAIT